MCLILKPFGVYKALIFFVGPVKLNQSAVSKIANRLLFKTTLDAFTAHSLCFFAPTEARTELSAAYGDLRAV